MIYYLEINGDVITVQAEEGGGSLSSTFHGDTPKDGYYITAINGLEALILAHACAGVDVSAPAYVDGIKTAVQSIANEF